MDIAEIVAHSLFVTAGITILYIIIITAEVKRGVRLAKKPRQYADQKIKAVLRQIGRKVSFVNTLYERGIDEVEKDLVDPVTRPITETQQKYETLRTGRREMVNTNKKKVSTHLQKILEMHKKSKKKGRQKRNRKQRKQQQEREEKSEANEQAVYAASKNNRIKNS